jgi:hypothetical protein
MCTYATEKIAVTGSARRDGWFSVTEALVYHDHPVHAPGAHTLNIDLLNPGLGADARVAVELSPASAATLAEAILRACAALPAR